MKNIFAVILLATIAIVTTADANAQAQIRNGKRISLTYPDGITENKKFLFPTFDTPRSGYEDSARFTLNQFMTHILVDSLATQRKIYLDEGENWLPGAMVFVSVVSKITPMPGTVYIYKNDVPFDTLTISTVTGNLSAIYFGVNNGLHKMGN